MLVHGNRSAQDPLKRRSVVEMNNTEIEVPSVRTTRAKSAPRGIQVPSVENGVVSTRNDAMDEAPPVKTPSKNAPNRCKTIQSIQKEIVKAEPLKKEQFECNASMVANPDTPPRVTPRRSSSVKNRDKSVRRSIRKAPSLDDFVTTNSAIIHSTSVVEESHKAIPKRHRFTESSRKEADVPSEEQIVPRDTGVSISLPASDNLSSVSESDSSDNDRSSDEDFDPTIKLRKRRPIWDLDFEPDNSHIHQVPSVKNKKRKSGTPDGFSASPETSTTISSTTAKVLSKTKKSSTDHVVTSKGSRKFKCPICKKRWPSNSALLVHERIHTGKTPFKCATCGKCFNVESNLTRHQFIHTGEQPFACSICDKQFNDSSNRLMHERIHTGDRPHACSICNKRFFRRDRLRKHIRTHDGTSTEDLPDVSQESMDQLSSKEAGNLPDNDGDQKILYRSKSMEYIVEKMANWNQDKMYLVWSKKFSMELASSVSRSGRNCLLIVKKFKPASFPDVLNMSKMLHTFSIEIGPSAKPIRLFSFGGMVVPEKIIHNGEFESLTKLESKLSKFARSQGTGIVNIFKHEENNKGWYQSLRSNLKEDCIIANKE